MTTGIVIFMAVLIALAFIVDVILNVSAKLLVGRGIGWLWWAFALVLIVAAIATFN